MRNGDVLLMYAEAKAELGQLDASAQHAIQQLRDRAGIPLPVKIASMPQEAAIEFIRHERSIERAWEGLHLADIRTRKTPENPFNWNLHGTDVASSSGSFAPIPGQHTRSFSAARDYLWPIPAGERDLNPNLEQNPGY